MELIYTGKTKDLYVLADGSCLLQFKDDLTGEDGVFDPGANQVGLNLEGAGLAGLRLSKMFFELLETNDIPTHYIKADLDKATMQVKKAKAFGQGVEVICRYRAVGSFFRRYGLYVKEGDPLDAFVEFTLKDDERGDPPITEEGLAFLGLMNGAEAAEVKNLTKRICAIIKDYLAAAEIELYDIKLEFGRVGSKDVVALIDEISAGNMRAYRRGKRLEPLELAAVLLD